MYIVNRNINMLAFLKASGTSTSAYSLKLITGGTF